MRTRVGRCIAAGSLLVAASAPSGCGLLDGSSALEEALEYLPADATRVTFVDRAEVVARLGVDDINGGSSKEDQQSFLEKTSTDEPALTDLDPYLMVMGDAAFDASDIEWSATATGSEQSVQVWKLDDDVDFDKVVDDLEDAGYERSGSEDRPTFSARQVGDDGSGLIGGRYPAWLLDLALVPDEHLVVTGDVDTGLDVVTDDEDSLSDKGSFDDLLDRAPDQDGLEFAALSLEPACRSEGAAPVHPHEITVDGGTLGEPDSVAVYVDASEGVTVARLFPDEGAAEAEAAGLDEYLNRWITAVELDLDFTVDQEGRAVIVSTDFADRRPVVVASSRLADGPAGCRTP